MDWSYNEAGRLVGESRDEGSTGPDGVMSQDDNSDAFGATRARVGLNIDGQFQVPPPACFSSI